jgi:cytidylate kinase
MAKVAQHSSKIVIAIDGPAASGKGTLARGLAGALDFGYLDTGSLYRAVAFSVINQKISPTNEAAIVSILPDVDLSLASGDLLRTEAIGIMASQLAVMVGVRKHLLNYQRAFAQDPVHNPKGVILDGRDIGTVVCPDADLKIFIVADLNIRIKRRFQELKDRGLLVVEEDIRQDMSERDKRDRSRTSSPLTPALDSWLLDTSEKDEEETLLYALHYVAKTLRL